jgi:O-antigen/teichoic acid export membrane protein
VALPPTPALEQATAMPAHPVSERTAWNAGSIVVQRAAAGAAMLVATLLVARHLGSGPWGELAYLMAIFEMLRIVSGFGLDMVALRHVAVGGMAPREAIRHLLVLKTFLTAGVVAAVFAVLGVSDPEPHQLTIAAWLSLSLFAFNLTSSLTVPFLAEHRVDRLVPVSVVGGVVLVSTVVVGVWMGAGSVEFAALIAAFDVVLLVLTWFVLGRSWPAQQVPGAGRRLATFLLREAFPVALTSVLVIVYLRAGVFFVEFFAGMEAVGRYTICQRITEPCLLLASAVSMSAFPVFSRLVEERRHTELLRRFLRNSVLCFGFTVAAAAVLSGASATVLALLGPGYAEGRGVLVVLAWAVPLMFQNALSTALVNAFCRYSLVTAIATWNVITFVVLARLAAPSYGATGVAAATLITEVGNLALQLAVILLLLRRLRPGANHREAHE